MVPIGCGAMVPWGDVEGDATFPNGKLTYFFRLESWLLFAYLKDELTHGFFRCSRFLVDRFFVVVTSLGVREKEKLVDEGYIAYILLLV